MEEVVWATWVVTCNDNGERRRYTFDEGAKARKYAEELKSMEGVTDVDWGRGENCVQRV